MCSVNDVIEVAFSSSASQVGPGARYVVLLHQPPECWDEGLTPPCTAWYKFCKSTFVPEPGPFACMSSDP